MEVSVSPATRFILSTSGSEAALKRHNEALKNFGADVVYFTFSTDITAEQYAGLLKSPIVRGGAITGQGLKTGILPYIQHIEPEAKILGAVNTVINVSGELYGYNTDAYGFKTAIMNYLEHSDQTIKSAVVYGNGGVSGVAVRVLQDLGLIVGMAGRNQARVSEKANELNLDVAEGPYDLVVNATPISSGPVQEAKGLVPLLESAKLVFDHSMPEKDGNKNYLQAYCKENRLDFISGNEMYIPQMIKQWTLFLDGFQTVSGEVLSITDSDIKKAWQL